ncbi:MAG: hypothetical protein ACYS6I_06655, partial [Planctomycetota bacterium]
HQTYWVYDFSKDGSVGLETFPILWDATHTAALFGMLDEGNVRPFKLEEVYINYIWYDNTDGSDIPTTDCRNITVVGEKPLTVDELDIPVYEDQDCDGEVCGPPLAEGETTVGQLLVSLYWQPGEDPCYPNDPCHYAADFTATVVVDPNAVGNGKHEDFIFSDSTEPNGIIKLTFDETNWDIPQPVNVAVISDLDKEGNESYNVELTTSIDIADCNFGGPGCDPVTQTKGVVVVDNDIPFISALPKALALSESDPCVPECFEVRLSHRPDDNADVEVIVVAAPGGEYNAFSEDMAIIDPNFAAWTDPNRLTFTATTHQDPCEATMTSGWNVPQTICVEARDNSFLTEAWVVKVSGGILLDGLSEDVRYLAPSLNPDGSKADDPCTIEDIEFSDGELKQTIVSVLVEDNECGSQGYPPYDKNEDCYVDLSEAAILYGQWLDCTQPYDGGKDGWVDCEPLWGLE